MSRASYAGIQKVSVAAPSYNAQYSYSEPFGDHTVWFLDAISFVNHLRAIRNEDLGGIAIERLGREDPQNLGRPLDARRSRSPTGFLREFRKMQTADTVANIGQGAVVSVDDTQDDGTREITIDANGCISAVYTDFPTFPTLYHYGAGDEHEVRPSPSTTGPTRNGRRKSSTS